MFVRKMLLAVAMLQLLIVPGMTRAIKPDSAHRYQGGPKTEEHVMKNSRASMENNFIENNAPQYYALQYNAPQYNAHQYHGGPKGH